MQFGLSIPPPPIFHTGSASMTNIQDKIILEFIKFLFLSFFIHYFITTKYIINNLECIFQLLGLILKKKFVVPHSLFIIKIIFLSNLLNYQIIFYDNNI